MKKIYTILVVILFTSSIFAQAPEKMSYQAIVRDSGDNLVVSQAVGMQISILQGGATGNAVYVETQMPTANANGLVSLEIGIGTVLSGDFTTIDWENDTYFLKTETDPTGGTSYTITGTTQLMSVPYALHSKTAESITGGINESDPIFGASIAHGITAVDTVNWNNHTIIKHQFSESDPGSTISTIRNTWIDSPTDSIIVAETGTYLLAFYGTGRHTTGYSSQTTPDFDRDMQVRVQNITSNITLVLMDATALYTDVNFSGVSRRYISRQPSTWRIFQLTAGHVLKIQYNQWSYFTSHPSSWEMGPSGIRIFKVDN